MTATTAFSIPAWPADQLDSAVPPEPAAPYFDANLNAWVLSRYADVLAAFRDPRLRTVSISGKDQMDVRDDSGRLAARVAMQESLSHPNG